MSERQFREIMPSEEYPSLGWCVIAALDCLSVKDVPKWAYGQYCLYFSKRQGKYTSLALYRYIMEKCINDADQKDHDYIEYYLVKTVEEVMLLLQLCRSRGDRVLMTTTSGEHTVGLRPVEAGWKMVGFGLPTKEVVADDKIFKYIYKPEAYTRKVLGLWQVNGELGPNFVIVGPEKSVSKCRA